MRSFDLFPFSIRTSWILRPALFMRSALMGGIFILFGMVLVGREAGAAERPVMKSDLKQVVLTGPWKIKDISHLDKTPEDTIPGYVMRQTGSRTFHVYVRPLPDTDKRISYGAMLNFKYFAGLSYEYLRENLPGRKLSVRIHIPEEAVSPFSPIPNRLRITLKTQKGEVWTEYFQDTEWISVKSAGIYEFSMNIPDSPVTNLYGQMFDPEHIVLFSIDLFLMEGSKRHSFIHYSFSDLSIEGIDIDPERTRWQMSVDGEAIEGSYLPYSPAGSTFLKAIGTSAVLTHRPEGVLALPEAHASEYKGLFMSLAAFIPEELRDKNGSISLGVTGKNEGSAISVTKDLASSDLDGQIFLTVPLGTLAEGYDGTIRDLVSELKTDLAIKAVTPHTPEMMPIVVEPLKIKQGYLVPFDSKWAARDVQGVGAYPEMVIDPSGKITPVSGITVKRVGPELHQMDLTVRLKGGIDWNNPLYRVELVREFDEPEDLTGYELEMLINPLTDTTDVWQTPFRARIGLLDENDRVMLGPNVSLSEGLPATATLEVAGDNPVPKGLEMPDFDERRVKSLIINLEGPHGSMPHRDIELSFVDLVLRFDPKEAAGTVRDIDFSRQKRAPEQWQLTEMIKSYGGYILGINYPFPRVDVPETVMKVPLVYPTVGMKPTDSMHLGISSNITRSTMIEDFTVFAEHDLPVLRLFAFGHLEGVFEWDERGKDIYFGPDKKDMVKAASRMKVERLAEYLNAHGDTFITEESPGKYAGLERHVIKDLTALLDIHEEVEKITGKRLVTILCLYDFKIGEGVDREGPYHEFVVGEHPEVVTDPETKVKAHALMWKMLKTLSEDPRFYRYIAAIDVMNEPGNATALATKRHFPDLVNFVGESIYLAKDAVGPSMPVSVGSRSWPLDLVLWRPIAEGIDILKPHYWESLESYNIDKPGLWPLDMPASELWDLLASQRDGRPTGIGEINTGEDCKEKLLRIEKAGYGFTLLWSYSGHDGHDSKPLLGQVKEYQRGNLEFASLGEMPQRDVRRAFSYIFGELDIFEKKARPRGQARVGSRAPFRDEMFEKLPKIKDAGLKNALTAILNTAKYKGMELTRENTDFLMRRALAL